MTQEQTEPKTGWPGGRTLAVVMALLGLALALQGGYLISIGGSAYYSAAGASLLVVAWLYWRGRAAAGLLYAALLAATVMWSLWEVGLDGWALMPRLDVFVVLGMLLVLIGAARISRKRFFAFAAVFVLVPLVAMVAMGWTWWRGPVAEQQTAAEHQTAEAMRADHADWRFIGGSQGAQRYSELAQITPANVSQLQPVWQAHLGMPPSGMIGSIEATPLQVGDTLYTCNMHGQVIALDAETGVTKWTFDSELKREGIVLGVCRGVTYYETRGAAGEACAARIIQTTQDARLIAVDARDGKRCQGFGHNGEVNLLEGLGDVPKGYYYLTSPAALVRGKLVVGASVLDGQETNEPSGVIRAFDATTGAFAWAWDMGRPGKNGMPPRGEVFTRGTPNSWAPMTADDESGLVFVPTGNATPDYLVSHRTEAMNKYSSSIVALDGETGAVRWSFQTVHRDIWDYDVASPPTLLDFPTANGTRPAVVQATKRGQLFVLDRLTGEPLTKVVERDVPHGGMPPGEVLSPTQPYSVEMPDMAGVRPSEERMWGLTPLDQLWCRIRYREARYDGDLTPIGVRPTIVYPGYLGGSNWFGVAVDPKRGLLSVSVNHFPMYNRLVPREEANARGAQPYRVGKNQFDVSIWPQGGTGYAIKTGGFLSPLGVPCMQPPYSDLAVIELASRKIVWRTPLGTARDSGPLGIPSGLPIPMGSPLLGGSLLTRSGLLFIAATQERTFRAFDTNTGKLLWQDRLPGGGHANPMTYYSARSGRQFVVIPASGHPQMHNGATDYLVAYSLPSAKREAGVTQR